MFVVAPVRNRRRRTYRYRVDKEYESEATCATRVTDIDVAVQVCSNNVLILLELSRHTSIGRLKGSNVEQAEINPLVSPCTSIVMLRDEPTTSSPRDSLLLR